MDFELRCRTQEGLPFAELAEKHAADFALTADGHDRDNSFPFANWEQMRRSGFLAATVPADLGGMGVTAITDLVVAINRLARGDAPTAIGAAMHSVAFWYLARLLSEDRPRGDDDLRPGLRLLLRRCARGHVVACVAISEQGTSLGYPQARAEPGDDGYLVSGRKIFCTNSPAADIFLSSVRIADGGSGGRIGFALIPRQTSGVRVLANWDALGMRASGSGDVTFESCPLPRRMVRPSGPLGVLSAEILPLTMAGALVLAGAFLGIAERAAEIVAGDEARRRPPPPGPAGLAVPTRVGVPGLIGQNEVDLAASRGVLERAASLLEEGLRESEGDAAGLHKLMKEVQCANMAVKRNAINITDRCLTISGGRGYLTSNPLSRLYRDVRAGPFMQPFSELDAFEYIGNVRLEVGIESGG